MQPEDKILKRYGRDTGMSVPEGYFDNVFAEVAAKLPPMPQRQVPEKLSLWKKVQPYIYMAAMFAGIWLMMKVFHTVTDTSQVYLDNPPQGVVLAMADGDIAESVYLPSSAQNDTQLETEVISGYSDFDDFEADFGYTLSPQYASIALPPHMLD